ncbi:hypothetical protein GCM10009624_35410 [Gordonia sinesedis]
MSVVSVVVAVCVFALALMWSVVGVLGLRGALPRNRWFGVRTPATLGSDEAFGVAQRVAAPGTLGAAVICVVGAVLTLGVRDGWAPVFGVGAAVAAVLIVGLVGGLGVRAAEALSDTTAQSSSAGCGCCGTATTQSATDAAEPTTGTPADVGDGADPAADCGESSCASCALRGACTSGTGTDAPVAQDPAERAAAPAPHSAQA